MSKVTATESAASTALVEAVAVAAEEAIDAAVAVASICRSGLAGGATTLEAIAGSLSALVVALDGSDELFVHA